MLLVYAILADGLTGLHIKEQPLSPCIRRTSAIALKKVTACVGFFALFGPKQRECGLINQRKGAS